MTLAAIKKMTSRLTKVQKLKLVEELLKETSPLTRVSDQEIERRAGEVLSGKVKDISATESKAHIDRLMIKIKRNRQTRSSQ